MLSWVFLGPSLVGQASGDPLCYCFLVLRRVGYDLLGQPFLTRVGGIPAGRIKQFGARDGSIERDEESRAQVLVRTGVATVV